MRKLLDKVTAFIEKHQLMNPDKLYLVALSGGRDSVALLLILRDLGYRIEAVHCNFMLRGEESMRDEQFCRDLCLRINVPFHTVHFDTRAYSALHQVSIEMAARDLRYAHFKKLCGDIHAAGVCVAHHMDDSVETILLNLLRGTGIHGLTGIAPRRDNILRPLLGVRRKELEDYLAFHGQEYVDDSTNFVPDVNRNRLRLSVFPLLREINPAFVENIYRCAGYLKEVEQVYDCTIDKLSAAAKLPVTDSLTVARFRKEAIQSEGLLFRLLSPYGFNASQIEDIFSHLSSSQNRRFLSSTHELVVGAEVMEVMPVGNILPKPVKIPETGTYVVGDNERLRLKCFDKPSAFSWSQSPNTVHLDADKIRFPLILRHAENGDRFQPLGMTGKKLLSDFMTDFKMSLSEKRRQWVLVDADNQIIWVVGRRIDHRHRVGDGTMHIMEIEFSPFS